MPYLCAGSRQLTCACAVPFCFAHAQVEQQHHKGRGQRVAEVMPPDDEPAQGHKGHIGPAKRPYQRAAAQNVGVIAMKPLAGGNITDGTLAMRYILQNKTCTLAIPGMATLEEIEQNTAAAEQDGPLTPEELAACEAIRAGLSGNFCRRCGYCAPCTVGIDIPGIFTLENYLKHYDLADWARSRYESQTARAGDCIGCGKCEARCPYELPIREKLKGVAKAFGA